MAKYAPIHPGEILKTEFLDELGITPYALARDIGIDKGNLSRIINGKSAISADTALRLARFFGTSANSWMNLQSHYLNKSRSRLAPIDLAIETDRHTHFRIGNLNISTRVPDRR